MSNINLVRVDGLGLSYLETVGIPDGTVQAVEVLVKKAQAPNAVIRPELLGIAKQITTDFSLYRRVPEVASILLGKKSITGGTRSRIREAERYVETFCLSEWRSDELQLLDSLLSTANHQPLAG
ncbi:hypothetical protein [Polaromonas sp. JS666]|uniref:hypothetical protein n=1 Tax=Polaromonas sp. (strain JS666 / ATCC BAA-500) TaxID=296591 RepID=UPI000053585A|nr:hypothetical protein [Polaromonas sp. JS666]ABE47218.1 hypothetical protein Bpro_5362 [Polaromonas sp. JS666]